MIIAAPTATWSTPSRTWTAVMSLPSSALRFRAAPARMSNKSASSVTSWLRERLFGPNPSDPAGTPRSMLLELRVENLLLIERAELRLESGLNVITGETGAGKTVLAHALDLLLGGKPRPGIVRPGASEAYVEGVFAVADGLLDADELADLRERLPDDLDEIVLGRRVGAEGRTRA